MDKVCYNINMNLGELDKLSDEELRNIVIAGENIHIPHSRAAMAQRLLQHRTQTGKVVIKEPSPEEKTQLAEEADITEGENISQEIK